MSPLADKDTYAVYRGIKDGRAIFGVFDRDHDGGPEKDIILGEKTADPEAVPASTEYRDHFWVELDEGGEIVGLEFDEEFTAKKMEDYQDTAEVFDKLQERSKQRLDGKDDE